MIARSTTFDEALAEHLAALRARDIAAFEATLSRRDCKTVAPDGRITEGFDAVRAAHAEWFASDDDWSFEPTVVWSRAGDDVAVALLDVRYRNRPADEAIRFLLTVVFARESDGWHFVFDQNTPIAA